MRGDRVRLDRRGGKWRVSVRKGAENATQATWLALGGCGDLQTAMRLWLALMGGDERK